MKIRNILILFIIIAASGDLYSQDADTVMTYQLSPVEVTARKTIMTESVLDPSKDRISGIFNSNGFSLIRKGVFFAKDIYVDGLKKNDVTVTIDNERYHNACPNRMDSPLTRVNPIELESVELIKTSGNLLSGLGGSVNFHRKEPEKEFTAKVGISGNAIASESADFAVKLEGMSHNVTARYVTGKPYKDAEERTFADLYGYKENFTYQLQEVSFQGMQGDFRYGGTFTYVRDVSFPYLLMDEKDNKVFNGFVSYKKHKLYFNTTHHIMNNELRVSPMFMETDARNVTIGLVGDNYELFYRRWDAFNVMSGMFGKLNNHLIPNAKTISAAVNKQFSFESILIEGKLGVVNERTEDSNNESIYLDVVDQPELNNIYPVIGLSVEYSGMIEREIGYAFMIESALTTPSTEELFISVKKPMTNPNWIGNPNLKQPFKIGLRSMFNYGNSNLELFYTNLTNYVNLYRINGIKPILTYTNVDAYLIGINASFRSEYFDFNASYTYAENRSNNSPLAEIRPFESRVKFKVPAVFGVNFYVAVQFQSEQNRVDLSLGERTTPSWYKADIGLRYSYKRFDLNLEFENITNQLFYQHLSYLRDPFSSGMSVFEPGRNIYFSVAYSM